MFHANKPRLRPSGRGFSACVHAWVLGQHRLKFSKPHFDWQSWIVHIFILTNHRMKCHPPAHWQSVSWILSYPFISLASLLRCRGIKGVKSQRGFFFSKSRPPLASSWTPTPTPTPVTLTKALTFLIETCVKKEADRSLLLISRLLLSIEPKLVLNTGAAYPFSLRFPLMRLHKCTFFFLLF